MHYRGPEEGFKWQLITEIYIIMWCLQWCMHDSVVRRRLPMYCALRYVVRSLRTWVKSDSTGSIMSKCQIKKIIWCLRFSRTCNKSDDQNWNWFWGPSSMVDSISCKEQSNYWSFVPVIDFSILHLTVAGKYVNKCICNTWSHKRKQQRYSWYPPVWKIIQHYYQLLFKHDGIFWCFDSQAQVQFSNVW